MNLALLNIMSFKKNLAGFLNQVPWFKHKAPGKLEVRSLKWVSAG